MTPDHLLEHFNRIAEAPDAIPRLRRFILDLAVRGKLVEQDPNEEPASELLKRIEAEKARLVKEKKIKKPKVLPPIDDGEVPFELPTKWEWVRIRQITVDRGQTKPVEDFTYLDVTSINKEAGVIGEPSIVEPDSAPSRARKIVAKGDIIYSCVRPYLLNIAIVDRDISPPPIASTAFSILNPMGFTEPRLLWIALRGAVIIDQVETLMRGQAYPAINDSDFSQVIMPLPPLAEQKRIVAKVDELMALCDRLEQAQTERETQRQRLVAATHHGLNNPENEPSDATRIQKLLFSPANFPLHLARPQDVQALRQTILNLAVRGKLVPQDPNDEPASELLKRIEAEKVKLVKKGRLRKPRNSDKTSDYTLPFNLPQGWEIVQPNEITRAANNALTIGPFGSNLVKSDYRDSGVPIVFVNDITSGFSKSPVRFLNQWKAEELAYHTIDGGDLVIAKMGSPPGAVSIYPDDSQQAVITADCIKFSTHRDCICAAFILFVVQADYLKSQILDLTIGLGRQKISLKKFQSTKLALPPLAEQKRIVAKVDELMALCDQLEAQLTTTQTQSQQLLEACLREAVD